MWDYVAVSGTMQDRMIEWIDNLHEHFEHPAGVEGALPGASPPGGLDRLAAREPEGVRVPRRASLEGARPSLMRAAPSWSQADAANGPSTPACGGRRQSPASIIWQNQACVLATCMTAAA